MSFGGQQQRVSGSGPRFTPTFPIVWGLLGCPRRGPVGAKVYERHGVWQIVNGKVKRMWFFLKKTQRVRKGVQRDSLQSAGAEAAGGRRTRAAGCPGTWACRRRSRSRSDGAWLCTPGGDRCVVPRSACRALIDEVERNVTKARQKKVKVGSFQISPDGHTEEEKGIGKKLRASV